MRALTSGRRHPPAAPGIFRPGELCAWFVSLQQLDAFLAFARADEALAVRLKQPMDLTDLLELADQAGFQVEEADVIAAMVREEGALSDSDLQRRAGEEARKLRNFIPG